MFALTANIDGSCNRVDFRSSVDLMVNTVS